MASIVHGYFRKPQAFINKNSSNAKKITKKSAYKYYIHTGNGNVITVKADNSNTAIDLFNLLIERGVLDAEKAYLTKRPNGDCIAGCENRE